MEVLRYASHIPAAQRIARFIADDERFAPGFELLRAFPAADVFVTGGTARDAILGREPHDIHLTVQGVPENILTGWQRRNVAEALRNGLEITLPRTAVWDSGERQIRLVPRHTLPLTHDLSRRDFTVNAIAYSVKDGVLIDPFSGVRDLVEGELKFVGDPSRRLTQEPLLGLRAVRLATYLGLTLAEETQEALKNAAKYLRRITTSADGKGQFAVDRKAVGQEFLKILRLKNAHEALRTLQELGIDEHVAAPLRTLFSLVDNTGSHAAAKARRALARLHSDNHRKTYDHDEVTPGMALATIALFFEDGALHALDSLTHALHLHHDRKTLHEANTLIRRARRVTEEHPRELSPATHERFFTGDHGGKLLSVLNAVEHTRSQFHPAKEHIAHASLIRDIAPPSPPSLVHGRDLIALGLTPGPHLRFTLHKIRDAQLSGAVVSKNDALTLARRIICEM